MGEREGEEGSNKVEIQKSSREQCAVWYDRVYRRGGHPNQCSPTNPFRGLHLKYATKNVRWFEKGAEGGGEGTIDKIRSKKNATFIWRLNALKGVGRNRDCPTVLFTI